MSDLQGVTQTIVASSDDALPGNCLQAAVATFFGRPLEQVPHFGLFNNWNEALNLWLAGWYGLGASVRPYYPTAIPEGRYLLSGTSPRNAEWTHIVVAEGDEIVWDPHPSRDGLVDRTRIVRFYAIDEVGRDWLEASRADGRCELGDDCEFCNEDDEPDA
jgi:hypothetical protein